MAIQVDGTRQRKTWWAGAEEDISSFDSPVYDPQVARWRRKVKV